LTQTPSDPNERLEALSARGTCRDGLGRRLVRRTVQMARGACSAAPSVDATVGEEGVEGAEIIGYDDDRKHY